MEELKQQTSNLLANLPETVKRQLPGNIDWDWRLNGILGSRGTGKTTLLLQKLKALREEGKKVLYASLDNFYFTENRPFELAEQFRNEGGQYLYLDEVHKYPDWSRELKNIYDTIPVLIVAFSGSSIIELGQQQTDLSRRALIYELPGLSFREYLLLTGQMPRGPFSLEEIITHHVEISQEIKKELGSILPAFKQYLQSGYFPFFTEPHRDYRTTLSQIIELIIESDLAYVKNFDPSKTRALLTLLRIIASSVPFKPNISKLSERIGVYRSTLIQYLDHLEKARLITLLNHPDKKISRLQKPDKIFLQNPNLFWALYPEEVNIGSVRESFVLSQLDVNHEITLNQKVDFLVDGKLHLEVGGKKKGDEQIKNLPNAYVLKDDTEIGYENRIPLWLMGFLY